MVPDTLNATVRDIYDGDNVLNNAIKIGDTLSGSYAFNTSTVDSDPSVAFGHFAHLPGSGEYGFDITVNNHSIKTDSSTAQFNIFLYDGQPSYDSYAVDEYGSQIPFVNGSVIEYLNIYIGDPSGNSIHGATLTSTPPVINSAGYNEFYTFRT